MKRDWLKFRCYSISRHPRHNALAMRQTRTRGGRAKGRWGLTLGNYINSQNVEADPKDPLFRHEYGHTLQSRLVRPLYLTHVGLPSFIGSGLDEIGWHSHNAEWNEIQANRMAYSYFNKFESSSLDRSKGGRPWDDNEYPRQYVYDWYFAVFHPPVPFMWWLFF